MKLVLTSGATTKTYGVDTANILQRIRHKEAPYSQTAQVLVENFDNTLSSLSLEGYQGVLSYGFETSAGNQFSATAPLKVKAQELLNVNGMLLCQFDLFGLPDQLARDKALFSYSQESTDTNTVKTLITAIAGATLISFSHTTAITVIFDSEDSLIDSFQPKDFFHIGIGESRLAKIKELLSWTKCVMRFESDGNLHISSPTTTGVTYDYEYEDDYVATSHPFFSKIYRTRLVLPNKYIVKSPESASPIFEGSATSAASFALLPFTEPKILRIASNAQGDSIAAALIQRAELDYETGSLFAPMNVGQEVHDYIKVTDNVEGANRVGNIGYLIRNFTAGKFDFMFGFGDISLGSSIGLGGLVSGVGVGEREGVSLSDRVNELGGAYSQLDADLKRHLKAFNEHLAYFNGATFPKRQIFEELLIPAFTFKDVT